MARNGFTADLHEFTLSPQGTALFIAAKQVPMDLTPYGGPKNGSLEDSAIQEISLRTGRLVFQWDMLKHVNLREAQTKPPAQGAWDPFHMNSVDEDAHGHLLLSARNTWAIYEITHNKAGKVLWQLGGKGSSFKGASNASFSWQHDARLRAGNEISLFDDACCDLPAGKPAHYARGLTLKLDFRHHTATVARQYEHTPRLYVPTQGNVQALAGGNVFVGWGQLPWYSEYTNRGRVLYDVRLPTADESYRALRLAWVGVPFYAPSLAARRAHGRTVLDASWNGATRVASWAALVGPSPQRLAVVVRRARRAGFETAVRVNAKGSYFEVKALDSAGGVLGTSKVLHLRR